MQCKAILIVAAMLATVGCERFASARNAVVKSPLPGGMRLELGKTAGATVRLTIFNGSTKTYWVNARMLWSSVGAPKQLREVDIEITDSNGKRLFYDCRDYAFPAVRPDYMLLHPGQFVGAELTLGDCVILRPGRYRVVAHYLDSNDVAGLQPSHPRFDQPLTSRPLDLIVE
jgi:hypothetical protein